MIRLAHRRIRPPRQHRSQSGSARGGEDADQLAHPARRQQLREAVPLGEPLRALGRARGRGRARRRVPPPRGSAPASRRAWTSSPASEKRVADLREVDPGRDVAAPRVRQDVARDVVREERLERPVRPDRAVERPGRRAVVEDEEEAGRKPRGERSRDRPRPGESRASDFFEGECRRRAGRGAVRSRPHTPRGPTRSPRRRAPASRRAPAAFHLRRKAPSRAAHRRARRRRSVHEHRGFLRMKKAMWRSGQFGREAAADRRPLDADEAKPLAEAHARSAASTAASSSPSPAPTSTTSSGSPRPPIRRAAVSRPAPSSARTPGPTTRRSRSLPPGRRGRAARNSRRPCRREPPPGRRRTAAGLPSGSAAAADRRGRSRPRRLAGRRVRSSPQGDSDVPYNLIRSSAELTIALAAASREEVVKDLITALLDASYGGTAPVAAASSPNASSCRSRPPATTSASS